MIFNRIVDALTPTEVVEERAYAFGAFMDEVPSSGSAFTNVGSGNAMQELSVYACVRILADAIATLPVDAYSKPSEQVRRLVSPQPKIVTRPWPYLTLSAWLWTVVQSLALTGNAFLHVQARDNLDYPVSLLPLHPDSVTADPNEGDWTRPIYRVGGGKVADGDIVHIRRFPIAGQAKGLSPIQQAARDIGISLAARDYAYRFFRDSANPSSILHSDQNLTSEQVQHTQKQWIQSQGGRRLPAVLGGGFDWKPISITPEESQFLATRQFQRGEIAALVYGIPPHMVGDTTKSTSWGSGLEQQSIGFVVYTLRAWLKPIEEVWTDQLPRGKYAQFNIDGLLRGDQKARWEAYQLGRNIGVYSVNEIREREDLPPVEDGDGRIQAVNYGPLGADPADAGDAPTDDPADDPANPDDPDPDAEPDDAESDDDSSRSLRNAADPSFVQWMTAEERELWERIPADARRGWVWLSDAERRVLLDQAALMRAQPPTRRKRSRRRGGRHGSS